MKIETLLNLVSGELLNSPYISEVTSFTDNVDDVMRGSCFFVKDSKDIKEAIKRGAYAIVSTQYEDIIDKEIAWIKCNSIEKSIINIFKYENLSNEVFECDDITLEIIKKMNTNKNVIFLDSYDDLLLSLNIPQKIVISSKKEFISLFAKKKRLKSIKINLIQTTLFKSKFNETELNLPFIYKDNFSKALNFFEIIAFFEIDKSKAR